MTFAIFFAIVLAAELGVRSRPRAVGRSSSSRATSSTAGGTPGSYSCWPGSPCVSQALGSLGRSTAPHQRPRTLGLAIRGRRRPGAARLLQVLAASSLVGLQDAPRSAPACTSAPLLQSSCRSASPSTRSRRITYVVDVYRGDMRPTRDCSTFAVFVTFFPHLVAGPIVRPSDLLPQLRSPRRSTRAMARRACS